MRHLLIVVSGSILFFGCASRVTTSGTAGAGKYSEDLSVWRPEAQPTVDSAAANAFPERTRTNQYVEAKHAVNNQVNAVLDSIYDQNLDKGFIDGYTIQVYSGIKREDALSNKKKMSTSLPDPPRLTFGCNHA